MGISGLSSANAGVSARRGATILCNRKTDYRRRIAAAAGDPRMQVSHAADAVRAASKNLSSVDAARVVEALLALAGLSDDPRSNEAAAYLLRQVGGPAAT